MFLKRRNTIAIVLLLLAAVCWTLGQQILTSHSGDEIPEATHPGIQASTYPAMSETTAPGTDPSDVTIPTNTFPPPADPQGYIPAVRSSSEQLLGFILAIASVIFGIVAGFALSQKRPVFGPDGICMLGGIVCWTYDALQNMDYIMWSDQYERFALGITIIKLFLMLLFAREILGWIIARFPVEWCLVQRISLHWKRPQISILFSAIFITAALSASVFLLASYGFHRALLSVCCFAAGAIGGACQLWRYGTDLRHFQVQLDHYQQGLPITVKSGAFSEAEAQLLEMRKQHEEAVNTAVTSERFKVELISNVSHDLRTPLTSILGYSELLQNEALSPEGQEQLRRLHQKAGYMNDLVESLFELTKVSSGVVESKKEQIDLVRLMEQTIGLFDDQLVSAGLVVKRSYCADTIPAITDGARMHQVFANLLGNAIKYALAGTRIYLEVRETNSSYLIRMLNTASYEMDFKPDEIMQRFARGDKARSTKGSGLGLAIAQTYTESVGGSFRVSVDGDQFSAIVELPKN